jgi:hypothetical protein
MASEEEENYNQSGGDSQEDGDSPDEGSKSSGSEDDGAPSQDIQLEGNPLSIKQVIFYRRRRTLV